MNNSESSLPVALVSGASGGIGAAICRLLIGNGYRVVAAARNQSSLQELAKDLGDRLYPLVLDVTDAAAVEGLAEILPEEFSDVSVLINNAGHDIGGRRSFEEGSADQWCDIIETNVQGTIRLTRALIDGMLARGSGHVVNMGSIVGLTPQATMTAYVSSKYAVHGLSETLRLDYAGRGIRVTEIMPGLVRTGFAQQRLGDAQEAEQYYDSLHVEIAQLVILPVS